jgi:hypothetical protein
VAESVAGVRSGSDPPDAWKPHRRQESQEPVTHPYDEYHSILVQPQQLPHHQQQHSAPEKPQQQAQQQHGAPAGALPIVPISAQLELFSPPYDPTLLLNVS